MKQFLTKENEGGRKNSKTFMFSKLGWYHLTEGILTKRRLCLTFISPNQTDLSLWQFSSVKSQDLHISFLFGKKKKSINNTNDRGLNGK